MLQGQYVVMDGFRGAQGREVGLPRLKLHHFLSINNKQQNKTAKHGAAAAPTIQLASGKNWHTSMREGAGCARWFINDTRGQRKKG
jgi:hypothetical protein